MAYFQWEHSGLYIGALSTVYLGLSIIYPACLSYGFLAILTIALMLICIITVLWVHIRLSSRHVATVGAEHSLKAIESFRISLMKDYDSSHAAKTPQVHYPPIFGRTVDSLLQQLLDFVVRDYVLVYLKDYAYNCDSLGDNIKEDMWGALELLHERFARVDQAKLIACDVVSKITNHFEKIREAKAMVHISLHNLNPLAKFKTPMSNRSEVIYEKLSGTTPLQEALSQKRCTFGYGADSDRPPVFALSPHVMSSEKELKYIRCASEIFIMFLLPRSYSLSPSKYFLREILTCRVFEPFIDLVTDPDFFNQNVIYYIEAQKVAANVHVKAFEYARSFEEILKIISKTDDVEALKSIRYNLVTKLMQATTLQNLHRSKGVDLDNEKGSLSSSGVNKSDINAAKKLRKYINQLTIAKKECEKRLTAVGWELGYQFNDDVRKTLPISSILGHVLGRKYLSQFLETLASQDLVRYWIAVEELRTAHRKNWHQLGAEIFYTFIRNPTSEIKIDKNTRKRMEAFLLGDKGPEVFYEIQCQVVQTIEDKYYQSFLISDYYKEMVAAMEKEDELMVDNDSSRPFEDRQMSGESSTSMSVDSSLNVGDHSNYAKQKLDQLEERLNNKTQALQALKTSLRPESKVLTKLEKEVEWLQGERRQLEAHLSRTEIWGENLGKWRTVVQSAEIPDEREPPQFVLVVHMAENDSASEEEESISTGWVVCRSLPQFQELHRKLRPLCSEIRSIDLPSNTFKFLFGKTDRTSLERAKQQIQKYLDFILTDDKLNQSEAVYSFLSPSSDRLKQSTSSPKKSRFSFSTLFKRRRRLKHSPSLNACHSDDTCSSAEQSRDLNGLGGGGGGGTTIGGGNSVSCSALNKDGVGIAGEDEDISQCLDSSAATSGGSVSTGSADVTDFVTIKYGNNNGHHGSMRVHDGGTSSGASDTKDTIAEPLYGLLSELFDMRGVFKYVRKTLIAFVQIQQWLGNESLQPGRWGWTRKDGQNLIPIKTNAPLAPDSVFKTLFCRCTTGCQTRCGCRKAGMNCSIMCSKCQGSCTNSALIHLAFEQLDEEWLDFFKTFSEDVVTYGRNINRQIYETISWWFSEQMLHYYVTLLLKSYWPGGTLAPAAPERTFEEKIATAKQAQELFVNNVPELLVTLVGTNAAKSGAKKVFDALQEKNMNKQLFYDILQVLIDAGFPELS